MGVGVGQVSSCSGMILLARSALALFWEIELDINVAHY